MLAGIESANLGSAQKTLGSDCKRVGETISHGTAHHPRSGIRVRLGDAELLQNDNCQKDQRIISDLIGFVASHSCR